MDTVWRINLLGAFSAQRGSHVLPAQAAQKMGALLAFLAYYGHTAHPRDLLVDLLWPDLDPEAGRNNLRTLLHALRRQLAAAGEGADRLILSDRATVRLHPEAFTTDLGELEGALIAADRASTSGARIGPLAQAARYTGELLPESGEAWVLQERETWRERRVQAMHRLVHLLEVSGDRERAIRYAHQAVRMDPLREESTGSLMRLYAADGQPGAALRGYQELERLLRAELDETPSAATRALAEELRDNARTFLVVSRNPRAEDSPPASLEAQRHGEGHRADSRETSPAVLRVSSAAGGHPRSGSPSEAGGESPALPVQLTRFFGREQEIAGLTGLLAAPVTRLVTVTGPGGSGKTRLVIAVAGRLQEVFGDRIAFVPLADLTDAARIPDAIADALKLTRSPEVEAEEQIIRALQGVPWLLVLDNFEHLLEGPPTEGEASPHGAADGSQRVRFLLEQVPSLTCLVTSRWRLDVGGEQEYALLPLPTPRHSASLEQLQEYASVQLFVDRARLARGGFQLTTTNAASVAELCDRLDGLPLALELAAARAGVLSPGQMLAELKQRFAFLVSLRRDLPARHRTLRAAIDSSYRLLAPDAQRFFRCLSVFRGGWTLEAARSVCDEPRALDYLEQLRRASLIEIEERGEVMRYRLLETLREYAEEQKVASGEEAAVRQRHLDWFLQLAQEAAATIDDPALAAWSTRLEADHENLRVALAWCREASDAAGSGPSAHDGGRVPLAADGVCPAAEAGLRLAAALVEHWLHRGSTAEGLQWLEGALDRGEGLPAPLRAPAFHGAAVLADKLGDPDPVRSHLASAREEYEKVLALARTEAHRPEVARTLTRLADIALRQSDWDAAWTFGMEARPLIEALGDRVMLAKITAIIAGAPLGRGDLAAARPLLEAHLAMCRELATRELLIHALGGMGHVLRDLGDFARARELYCESLVLRRELGNQIAVAQSLEDLAALAGREGEFERAIRLLGANAAFCETLGARPPVAKYEEYERVVAQGRTRLGDVRFAAAWAAGRAMSLDAAIAFAMQVGDAAADARRSATDGKLTERL